MDRLNRIRMLLGDSAVEKLAMAHVMVVGCGAVGSFAIEALARSGIGTLTLVDFDNVATSNINRQLFALDSTVGQAKVDVAAARIHDINPDITVHPINMRWGDDVDIDIRPDFVIDAIDDVAGKIALYKWCRKHDIPFISSMGAARKCDIAQIRLGRISKTTVCPLAAKIRRLVRDENIGDFPVVYSTEPANPTTAPNRTFGSIITVTGTFGLRLAQFVIDEIIK